MSTLFVSGRFIQSCLLAVFTACALVASTRLRRTSQLPIRPLAAVAAIKDAVGRATELGRPVHFTFGSGNLDAQAFAAFAVLSEVSNLCAQYDCTLIVSNAVAAMQPMAEEVVKQAYQKAGKGADFDRGSVLFAAGGSYNAAVLGTIERRKVAASILMGNMFYESVLFIEAASRSGALQIGGTMNTHQLPFVAAGCDYSLIGAEMFAAGAYLTKDSVQLGWLVAEEICKLFALLAILLGTLAASLGFPGFGKLLAM